MRDGRTKGDGELLDVIPTAQGKALVEEGAAFRGTEENRGSSGLRPYR